MHVVSSYKLSFALYMYKRDDVARLMLLACVLLRTAGDLHICVAIKP